MANKSEITIEQIKKLKELSGAGLTDAKKALVEADGDFDKALEAMRKKGLTKAEKRGERRGIGIGIKGTVATLLRLGMERKKILDEITQQFQLDEDTAREYLEETLDERRLTIDRSRC